MYLNAKKEVFELVELDGIKVLFTNARLDRATVPDGLYCYDIRETEGGSGIAATLEPYVLVNHWGTVLSKQAFLKGEQDIYNIKTDLNYLCEDCTIAEFMEQDELNLECFEEPQM